MSIYDYNPDSGPPRDKPDPDTDEAATALREAATAERYRVFDANACYGPGLYAVRMPRDGNFGRCLSVVRKIGDYEMDEGTWYVGVAVPRAASAYMLSELAGLGAVITKCSTDQEGKP